MTTPLKRAIKSLEDARLEIRNITQGTTHNIPNAMEHIEEAFKTLVYVERIRETEEEKLKREEA